MRHTIISKEYVFQFEVIPLFIIGILLNLLGFFAAEHLLGETQLFIDMGGTAFTAILLGPWWGASAGVLTNIINGTISSNYFPYGIVHVTGALFWGYYSRAVGFGRNLPGNRFFSLSRFLVHFFVLAIVGGMITGGTSSMVKLILYPIMERPWIVNESMLAMAETIRNFGLENVSDPAILLLLDMKRDVADKLVSVALMVAIISWIVFLPNRLYKSEGIKRINRIKTDNVSVLFFFICYGFYLAFARIARPVISISGAKHDLNWLTSPSVIAMLYAPIILALLVFLLFSLEPTIGDGRIIEIRYQLKKRLYFRFSRKAPGQAGSLSVAGVRSLLQKYNVYGLAMSIALWPAGKMTGKTGSNEIGLFILIYIVVIVLYMFVYFLENNSYIRRALKAQQWTDPLKKWLEIESGSRESLILSRSLKSLFGETANITDTQPLGYNHIVYFPVSNALSNAALLSVNSEIENTYLIVVIDKPGMLSVEIRDDIEQILSLTGIRQALVLTLCPILFDEAIKDWIRTNNANDIHLVLLSWIDIELLIEQFVSGRFKQKGIYDAILNTAEQCGIHDSRWSQVSVLPGELHRRSLPMVRYIVERLAPRSRILDIGAGLGRHSMLALEHNFEVVAIEIKPTVFDRLTATIAAKLRSLNLPTKKATLVFGDYLTFDPAAAGEVDLVIAAGVLQHVLSPDELSIRLQKLLEFARKPGARIYIEALLDMKFDDQPPADGRFAVDQTTLETLLKQVFPDQKWTIRLLFGPSRKIQDFSHGPTSFVPIAKKVETTTLEYLIEETAKSG